MKDGIDFVGDVGLYEVDFDIIAPGLIADDFTAAECELS